MAGMMSRNLRWLYCLFHSKLTGYSCAGLFDADLSDGLLLMLVLLMLVLLMLTGICGLMLTGICGLLGWLVCRLIGRLLAFIGFQVVVNRVELWIGLVVGLFLM